MLQTSYSKILFLLASCALTAACGGGGESAADTALTPVNGGNLETPSASTPASDSTTSTHAVTTTTAVSSTTTSSSTTTTVPSNNGAIPPLSATRIELIKGAGGQVLGTPAWGDGYGGGTGAAIGNANCDDWSRSRNYFGHAHLSIFRNGERLAIPQYIGWRDECIYDINTDNRNGVIDAVSATGYRYFSLGEFFQIWGQPLSWDNIAGITNLPVVIYIEDSGVVTQYTGDPANIELGNFRSITIQIGSRLDEIPTYNWNNYTGGE